jgi:hypothetical protein
MFDPGKQVERMDEFKTCKIIYNNTAFTVIYNNNHNATWIDFIKMFPGVIEDKAIKVTLSFGGYVCSVTYESRDYVISWSNDANKFRSNNVEEIWRRFLLDWQQFGVGVRGLLYAPMAYNSSNSSNVIGMLYELRNMHRNMHDGARTLR